MARTTTVTLNDFKNVQVIIEPVGLIGSTGDGVFEIRVQGDVLDADGQTHHREEFMTRSDDPVILAAPFNLNQTTLTNTYRKLRRAWKVKALDENSD